MAKIRFKKSTSLEEYHGFHGSEPIDFLDNEEKEIDDEKAKELLAGFPDNFELHVEVKVKAKVKEIKSPPKDTMIKKASTKKKSGGKK